MQTNFYELGGEGPTRLSGTSAITGCFYCIMAGGEGMVVSTLTSDMPGVWADFSLAPGQFLMTGNRTITSITLTSGDGFAYTR